MKAEAARDYTFAVIKTYADAQSLTVKWPDVPFEKPATAAYFEATFRHAVAPQSSLADTNGQRIWTPMGVASATVHVPIARGLKQGYTLAQGLTDALRGSRGDVWFRNIRLRELGSEGGYERVQVLWDFEYRDIQ